MSPKLVKFQSAKVSSNTDNLLPLLQIAAKSSKGTLTIAVDNGVIKIFLNGYELQKGDNLCLNEQSETLFYIPALSLKEDSEFVEDDTDLDDEENFDDDSAEDEDEDDYNDPSEDDKDDSPSSDDFYCNDTEEVIKGIERAFSNTSSGKIVETGKNYIKFENVTPGMFQNLRTYTKDADLIPDDHIRNNIKMENEYNDDTGFFTVTIMIKE
ncbi:MAG: hypothetical protein J6Y02_18135 [Pseudobutyrivibrio sp.]|nr:hypothetical protein [Pseudobutyrivibrio sp.]